MRISKKRIKIFFFIIKLWQLKVNLYLVKTPCIHSKFFLLAKHFIVKKFCLFFMPNLAIGLKFNAKINHNFLKFCCV